MKSFGIISNSLQILLENSLNLVSVKSALKFYKILSIEYSSFSELFISLGYFLVIPGELLKFIFHINSSEVMNASCLKKKM